MTTVGLPYTSLDKNSTPPSLDPYHYPLRLDNHLFNHPRQDLRHQNLPVNRTDNGLQDFITTHNLSLKRLTQTTTESKYEVTMKLI